MTTEKTAAADKAEAGLVTRPAITEPLSVHGRFEAVCIGADGKVKWVETFDNVVTTAGKNDMLDKYLGAGTTTAAIMGLKGTGTAVVGDTQASHAGWLEVGSANAPTYTAPRKTPTQTAASSGSKATTSTSFAMTGTGTVFGCFINVGGTTAIDNTTGVLYSAGDFSASRAVLNGDTINVTYTATLT